MVDYGSELYQTVSVTVTVTKIVGTGTVTLTGLISGEINMKRNTAMQWKLVFSNSDRSYVISNSDSDFFGFIAPNENLMWNITIETNGTGDEASEEKEWSYLVCLDYRTSVDSNGNMIATFTGTDWSYKLMQSNQSMASWVSVAGSTVYSNGIVGDICDEYSVAKSIGASTYPVRIMHFQAEKPMDAIERCLKPIFAEWYVSGNTFYTRDTQYGEADDWEIIDYKTIEQLELSYTPAEVVTKVTALRVQPGSKVALDVEGTGENVGANTNSLDFAIVNASLEWDAVFGDINTMRLLDGDDNYAGDFPLLPPDPPATQLYYVFQQIGGLTEDQANRLYYHIIVKGDKPQSGAEWGDLYEEDYEATLTNTTLEIEIGESIPAQAPILEEMIPNQTWAEVFAENYLIESAKRLEQISGKIGFYVSMTPGQNLKITNYYTGTFAKFYTEEVRHSFNGDSAFTSIVCTKPRSDTIA